MSKNKKSNIQKHEYEVVRFDGSGYAKFDAEKEGTFLDEDYGNGMYFQKPAEILVYRLLIANKENLVSGETEQNFEIKALLEKIDSLVDFPAGYTLNDFHSDINATFKQGGFSSPATFMSKLKANINLSNASMLNKDMMLNSFFRNLKHTVHFDDNATIESVIYALSTIETPPAGVTKIDLITNAMKIAENKLYEYAEKYGKYIKSANIDLKDEDWFKKAVSAKKEEIEKRKEEEATKYAQQFFDSRLKDIAESFIDQNTSKNGIGSDKVYNKFAQKQQKEYLEQQKRIIKNKKLFDDEQEQLGAYYIFKSGADTFEELYNLLSENNQYTNMELKKAGIIRDDGYSKRNHTKNAGNQNINPSQNLKSSNPRDYSQI
jgi:hypothetical protein